MSLPRALARGALAGLACGVAAVASAWGVWWALRLLHDGRPGVMMQLDSQRAVTVGELLLVFGAGAVHGAALGFLIAGWVRRDER